MALSLVFHPVDQLIPTLAFVKCNAVLNSKIMAFNSNS